MSSPSLMHRVFPPSKPPDGGYPPSFRLIVGGTQLRGSWYLSAIVRLQGFSSCSPAAPLHRRSPKMVTSGLMVGESEPGCGLCPSLSLTWPEPSRVVRQRSRRQSRSAEASGRAGALGSRLTEAPGVTGRAACSGPIPGGVPGPRRRPRLGRTLLKTSSMPRVLWLPSA